MGCRELQLNNYFHFTGDNVSSHKETEVNEEKNGNGFNHPCKFVSIRGSEGFQTIVTNPSVTNPNAHVTPESSVGGTDMLYSGEQFDPNLQMQYLRARYYDQNNGRFNRLDDYMGSNSDPRSLHKYAYCDSDPINSWDPTGKFTLVERLVVSAVQSILISQVTKVVGSVLNSFIGKMIPVSWYERMSAWPTAYKLGVDLGITAGKGGIGVRGGGGLDMLYSTRTKKLAVYGYLQAGVAFTNKKISSEVGLNLGFVWNTHFSGDYTEHFAGISFQFRFLPKFMKEKLRDYLFRLALSYGNLKPSFDLMKKFRFLNDSSKVIETSKRHLARLKTIAYSSQIGDKMINISAWGPVVSFSLTGLSYNVAGGKYATVPISASYQYYWQLYPRNNVSF